METAFVELDKENGTTLPSAKYTANAITSNGSYGRMAKQLAESS